jgi:hypothetical protein
MTTGKQESIGASNEQTGRAFFITVPDALACEPPACRKFGGTAHVHPRYLSSVVDLSPLTRGTAKSGSPGIEATWRTARIGSMPNEQFATFHRTQSSHSSVAPKTGRLSSGLGPHERSWAMELEVDPYWVDYEMQGVAATFSGSDGSGGALGSYRADWIAVDWHGTVHVGEIKAHHSYYLDPEYSGKLIDAGNAFASIDIRFRHATGDARQKNVRRMLNVSHAYGDAFTEINERHLAAIKDTIAEDGGITTVGRIEAAIGGHSAEARSITHAALCRRLITYDLDKRVDAAAIVTVPPTPPFITNIRAIDKTVTL